MNKEKKDIKDQSQEKVKVTKKSTYSKKKKIFYPKAEHGFRMLIFNY